MITDFDRAFTFGASDTHYFFMNRKTKTFKEWWDVKMGFSESNVIENKYIIAGTMLEEPVVACINFNLNLGIITPPTYIWSENPKLKVNLDGLYLGINHEVKTVGFDKWLLAKPDIKHWQQVQVQMLVSKTTRTSLDYYGVMDYEYEISYLVDPDIDFARIRMDEIEYDEEWIEIKYLSELEYLTFCMDTGNFPENGGIVWKET